MSGDDFSRACATMLVIGIAIGAIVVLLIVWLWSYLHIAVRWI